MNNNDAIKITQDLIDEFRKIEAEYKVEYDNNIARIEEIDTNIALHEKNDDIDFKVFSPRNVTSAMREKITKLNHSKDDVEKDNKQLLEQIKCYSERIGKLERLLLILNTSELTSVEPEAQDSNNADADSSANTVEEVANSMPEFYPESILFADLSKYDVIEDKVPGESTKPVESTSSLTTADTEEETVSKVVIDSEKEENTKTSKYPFDLGVIIHKLSLCLKFIDIDPGRAKDDIRLVIRMLQ